MGHPVSVVVRLCRHRPGQRRRRCRRRGRRRRLGWGPAPPSEALEDVVSAAVVVPELFAVDLVAQAELQPLPDGEPGLRPEVEGELVREAVAAALDVLCVHLRLRQPLVGGVEEGDALVEAHVLHAHRPLDGAGIGHVGVLQANPLVADEVEEVGEAAGLAEHGDQGGGGRCWGGGHGRMGGAPCAEEVAEGVAPPVAAAAVGGEGGLGSEVAVEV